MIWVIRVQVEEFSFSYGICGWVHGGYHESHKEGFLRESIFTLGREMGV